MVNEKALGVSRQFLVNAFERQILDIQTSAEMYCWFP